jgi:hypothetical protein
MKLAEKPAVVDRCLAAVALVPDVVDVAGGRRAVAAAGPAAVLVAQGDGAALTAADLPMWLRRARLVSLSLDTNGSMCRDLLRVRYGQVEQEEVAS